jgi:hypothetical protein
MSCYQYILSSVQLWHHLLNFEHLAQLSLEHKKSATSIFSHLKTTAISKLKVENDKYLLLEVSNCPLCTHF